MNYLEAEDEENSKSVGKYDKNNNSKNSERHAQVPLTTFGL